MGKYLGCTDDQLIDDHLRIANDTLRMVSIRQRAYLAVFKAALWEVKNYGQTQFPHHRAYFNLTDKTPLDQRAELLKLITAHHSDPTSYVGITPNGMSFLHDPKRPHITPTQIGNAMVYLTIMDDQQHFAHRLVKLAMLDILKP